jgi:hypothetical protein
VAKRKPKSKLSQPTERTYEVIDDAKVKEVVELFVDFASEKKIQAKLVMLAMEFIVSKIKSHLEVETVSITEETDTVH